MFKQLVVLLLISHLMTASVFLKEDCSNFNGQVGCQQQYAPKNPQDWSTRSFQTPTPDQKGYKDSYQSLSKVMCYNNVQYSADLNSATVEVRCRKDQSVNQIQYKFNDADYQTDNTIKVDNSMSQELKVTVQADSQYTIDLEPVNFVWQSETINQSDAYKGGQKGAIVEMFGWNYEDLEQECEAIGQMGYMGIKIFPAMESVFSYEWPQNGELNPWWFYYQPVSYKMEGRHGTRQQLRSMIQKCRQFGVRVYADAVINHMSGGGNDILSHRNGGGGWCTYWTGKSTTAQESKQSPYFTHSFTYEKNQHTGQIYGNEFPGVPYIATDFHCDSPLNSWQDPYQLNNGWLSGLTDLDTETEWVRNRIAAYMTDLLSMGFSGFRIDAAKHVQPSSLAAIFNILKQNMGGQLPSDFISYLEVLIGGEKDLLMCSDNYYSYGKNFENVMKQAGLSDSDIYKIKIWSADYPKEFPICGYWAIPSERLAVGLDCHDDQNPGSSSRDMGDKGSVLIKEKNVDKHREFEKQLFYRTDGNWQIKLILSSYTFKNDGTSSIPDGRSDCSKCISEQCTKSCSKSMPYSKAFDANSCGYDCVKNGSWQEGVYTRVHRDQQIINAMRQWQGLSTVNDVTKLGLSQECQNRYI